LNDHERLIFPSAQDCAEIGTPTITHGIRLLGCSMTRVG
jgi:hypothetical protein